MQHRFSVSSQGVTVNVASCADNRNMTSMYTHWSVQKDYKLGALERAVCVELRSKCMFTLPASRITANHASMSEPSEILETRIQGSTRHHLTQHYGDARREVSTLKCSLEYSISFRHKIMLLLWLFYRLHLIL